MLAVVKTKREPGIEVLDWPEPKLTSANDVLIEVAACGICGTDLKTYLWETAAQRLYLKSRLPLILGHEIAGTIVEVGKSVPDLEVGDRVACDGGGGCGFCYYCRQGLFNMCDNRTNRIGLDRDGGYARYVVCSGAATFKVPETMPVQHSACLQPFGVVVHAVERSRLKSGDYVVILGPGPIGLMAAMLVQANGAAGVMVAGHASSKSRLQVAADIGAETSTVEEDDLYEKVLSRTGGRGADIVIDCAGGSAALNTAIRVARKGAEIVLVGVGDKGEIDPHEIVSKELTMVGSFARQPSTWARAIAIAATGKIDFERIITHILPIERAEEGFQALRNREGLKVILTPSPSHTVKS